MFTSWLPFSSGCLNIDGMQDAINQIRSQIAFNQNLDIANKKGV
jgi:hypothetical protein